MIPKGDIAGIQREIFERGSVVAAFDVFESLMGYNGGIYYKKKFGRDEAYGGHAVRLVY
jgi:hypothetical protein